MWDFDGGLNFNTENPVVRDELWDNSEYYDDEDEEIFTEVKMKVDYTALDDEQAKMFKEDINLAFTFQPHLKWDDTEKSLTIEGDFNDDEREILFGLIDYYELESDVNW